MKWTVKLLLCFLIAWLPFAGYAAQTPFCQDAPVVVASGGGHTSVAHPDIPMVRAADMAGMSSHHPATCHGGSFNAQCGDIAALPTDLSVPAPASVAAAYERRDDALLPPFIPDLPQRPPSSV